MADEPQLKVERDGSVVVLTMNNPRRRNALTPAMITMMAQAWDEIDADDGIRVAILTGEGSSYCVGGDLADGWMVRGPKPDNDAAPAAGDKSSRSVISDGLLLSRSLATPLIAAVNGPCVGGGCEMLQQTDIRIAEEHAVFGLPEVQLGLIAGAGSTVRLKRQIPYTKAMEMILTGDPRLLRRPTNSRKGAALNAVQIAEAMANRGLLKAKRQGGLKGRRCVLKWPGLSRPFSFLPPSRLSFRGGS